MARPELLVTKLLLLAVCFQVCCSNWALYRDGSHPAGFVYPRPIPYGHYPAPPRLGGYPRHARYPRNYGNIPLMRPIIPGPQLRHDLVYVRRASPPPPGVHPSRPPLIRRRRSAELLDAIETIYNNSGPTFYSGPQFLPQIFVDPDEMEAEDPEEINVELEHQETETISFDFELTPEEKALMEWAKRKAEEAKKKAKEAAKRKAEEKARRRAEAAKKKAEAEAKRRAEEEAKRIAVEEAKRKAEEEVRRIMEEARRKTEEAIKRKAEALRKAEAEAKKKA